MTGVSGSGKSTLVNEVLYKAVANRLHRAKLRPGDHKRVTGLDQVDKIINIDQSPIGRTPRSNPATYTGLFDPIRDLFSRTQESRARGYKPGRFSFNVKGGRCEVCRGDGQIKIEMHFLPDVYVPCEQCNGKRYNRETLDVRFKGKTIADVLEMPVEEAVDFFRHIPKIHRRLKALHDVGLDYIRLGPAGDDAVGRRGAARQARQRAVQGRDRPDALHPRRADDRPALRGRRSGCSRCSTGWSTQGNTVVVIEHNLDVIKTADRIIDLGPEGGEEGGRIVGHRHARGGRRDRGLAHGPLPDGPGQARGDQAPRAARAREEASNRGVKRGRGPCRPVECAAVDPRLKLYPQKWRWYERNRLPWRARPHPPAHAAGARRSSASRSRATCSSRSTTAG